MTAFEVDSVSAYNDHSPFSDIDAQKSPYLAPEKKEATETNFLAEYDSLYAPNPTEREHIQEVIHTAIETLSEQATDEDQLRAIAVIGAIEEFKMLRSGEVNAPEGTVVRTYANGTPYLDYDPTIPYLTEPSLRKIIQKFGELGVDDLKSTRAFKIKINSVSHSILLKNAWVQSPHYAFFKNFENSVEDQEDLPLNEFWKRIRERQHSEEVKREFGLQPTDIIQYGSAASFALRRCLYGLDDEVQPQRTENETSSLESARAYFRTKILEYMKVKTIVYRDPAWYEFDSTTITTDDHGHISINTPGPVYTFSEVDEFSQKIMDEISPDTLRLNRELSEMVRMFVTDIFNSQYTTMGEIFKARANDSTMALAESAASSYQVSLNDIKRAPHVDVDDVQRVVGNAQYVELANLNAKQYVQSDLFDTRAEIYSKEILESSIARTFGWIRGAIEGNRLIVERRTPVAIPEFGPAPHFILILEDPSGEPPEIPGYDAVFKDSETEYGYRLSKEADPYQECALPIPNEKRQSLATAYKKAGLIDLAMHVETTQGLTVDGLVAALRSQSDYIFNEVASRSERAKPRSTEFIRTLDDIRSVQNNGRIEVQCTGASQVLRVSLTHIYGLGAAKNISGHVIHEDINRVAAVRHMQTQLTVDGQTYVLDATPSVQSEIGGSAGLIAGEVSARKERFASPTKSFFGKLAAKIAMAMSTSVPTSVQEKPISIDTSYEDRLHAKMVAEQPADKGLPELQYEPLKEDTRLADIRKNTEAFLRIHYDFQKNEQLFKHSSKLFKHSSKLPEHDPIRRTLQLISRAAPKYPLAEEPTYAEVESQIHAIKVWREASESVKAKYKLDSYNDSLFILLQNSLSQLKDVLDEKNADSVSE